MQQQIRIITTKKGYEEIGGVISTREEINKKYSK